MQGFEEKEKSSRYNLDDIKLKISMQSDTQSLSNTLTCRTVLHITFQCFFFISITQSKPLFHTELLTWVPWVTTLCSTQIHITNQLDTPCPMPCWCNRLCGQWGKNNELIPCWFCMFTHGINNWYHFNGRFIWTVRGKTKSPKIAIQKSYKLICMNIWMIQRRTCESVQMRPKSSFLASIQLAVFGGEWMLPMTPRNIPTAKYVGGNIMFWGCFLLKGQDNCTASRGRWKWAMYRQGQGIENGSWMGIPAWQWPKNTMQQRSGSIRSTLRSWSGLAISRP